MVMGHVRCGPKIDCYANYRPILSSERVPKFRIKKISHQEKKMKNLVVGLRGGTDTKRDWPTVTSEHTAEKDCSGEAQQQL
jgi:hypothetical protein